VQHRVEQVERLVAIDLMAHVVDVSTRSSADGAQGTGSP
jgi:hypothetical protein